MVKESMDLLELLRKRGVDGDVDFLLEALRVVADAVMDADVSARIGAGHSERSPDRLTTAMGIALASGTPGWARWSCGYRSSGREATFRAFLNRGVGVRRRCWRWCSRRTWRECRQGGLTIW